MVAIERAVVIQREAKASLGINIVNTAEIKTRHQEGYY